MNKYEVSLRGTDIKEIIEAQTSLEARVKFCTKHNLNYRVYANKLVVNLI